MKLILIFSVVLFCVSCENTMDVIKIKKEDKSLPIQFIYSNKLEVITGVRFTLGYNITNKSLTERKLNAMRYKSKGLYHACLSYHYYNGKLESILGQYRPILNKDENIHLVIRKSYRKTDTIVSASDLMTIPDSSYVFDGDTVLVYSLKCKDNCNVNLYSYYLKNDSIRFEFDDTKLPFYVKRSRYKEKIGGKTFEGKLDYPSITVPVLGN